MAYMCPMEGCKATKGMCGHEKIMLVAIILGALAFIGWKYLA